MLREVMATEYRAVCAEVTQKGCLNASWSERARRLLHEFAVAIDVVEMDDQRIQELAEAWHAPNCAVDAGGACVLDNDLKDAWIAGYHCGMSDLEV